MLLRGSNNRGARGQTPNRSRGSRGRGSTSRGASSSSSKYNDHFPIPSGPRAMRDTSNMYRGGYRSSNYKKKKHYSKPSKAGTSSTPNHTNPFEQERHENAAKREQRVPNGAAVSVRGGRGATRSSLGHKQVRFSDSPAQQNGGPFNQAQPSTASDSLESARKHTTTTFGTAPPAPVNPFVTAPMSVNPFSAPVSAPNPFGIPSQTKSAPFSPAVFGAPSGLRADGARPNPFASPHASIFSAPSIAPAPNPFAVAPPNMNGVKNTSSGSHFPPRVPDSSSLNGVAQSTFSSLKVAPTNSTANTNSHFSSNSKMGFPKPTVNGAPPENTLETSALSSPSPAVASLSSSSATAKKIEQHLRKQGISSPPWPVENPGDPTKKESVKLYWQTPLKGYRNRVRESLVRAGFLDDPDVPKRLSEAIDFKGTCEEMCPEFEKFTRIVDHSVDNAEKDVAPDGSLWPSMRKMVKALARSAAGQDAPLPMDVRTPAALRRTLDYLFHMVLADGYLPAVHGFLWDRTRAIRRDFVFQSAMNPAELSDQIYCLEHITRFHVIALHQMSNDEVEAEDFSEQQEVEQLGKALLSLIHAYDDCHVQRISCENEAEFRAYYILFNSHNTGILESVQTWGLGPWGDSFEIRTAASLVENLQNIWELRGPLKPHSPTDVAQNEFFKFFSTIQDKNVSYTMACFAEIHFNSVRKAVLKTVLASYRKQRDQTKDWTLSILNIYLQFDEEEDVVPFCEAYGLRFEVANGEERLAFGADEALCDPFPPLKQPHSYNLVERKRGDYDLPELLYTNAYEEKEGWNKKEAENTDNGEDIVEGENADEGEDEDELFVPENSTGRSHQPSSQPVSKLDDQVQYTASQIVPTTENTENSPLPAPKVSKPTSIFDQVKTPISFGNGFFSQAIAGKPSIQPSNPQLDPPSSSTKQPINETKSLFAPTPLDQQSSIRSQPTKRHEPLPSFENHNFAPPPTDTLKAFIHFGGYSVTKAQTTAPEKTDLPPPNETPKAPIFFGGHSVTKAQTTSSEKTGPSPPTDAPKAPALFSAFLVAKAQTTGSEKTDTGSVRLLNTANSPSNQPSSSTTAASAPLIIVPAINPIEPQSFGAKSNFPSGQTVKEAASSAQIPSLTSKVSPAPLARNKGLIGFSQWIALGNDGLVDHFAASQAQAIVKDTYKMFRAEESRKAAEEADALAREEADLFRYRSLATKYGHLWREAAHYKWLKRRGREARQARREMAETMRSSKAAQSANVVEDFRASTRRRRRDSLQSLLDSTGIASEDHDANSQISSFVHPEELQPASKRQRSDRSTKSASTGTSRHKGKSDNPLRRSLLSDPSYLTGGSRIHFMSKYVTDDENRRQVSGVQTDYFRLKARGITTLLDGTPLANSAANMLHQKRSFDSVPKPTTPKMPRSRPTPESVPAKAVGHSQTTVEGDPEIKALKTRTKTVVRSEKGSPPKRSLDPEDEELFARAKRVREQLDEGAKWYRKQIGRYTASRTWS